MEPTETAVVPVWNPNAKAKAPSWEKVDPPGFAGAFLTYTLRIRFSRDIDWTSIRPIVEEIYEATEAGYVSSGRLITLENHQLTLRVSGTSDELPATDNNLQTDLIALVVAQLSEHVKWITTERWTDTPFEEAPAKARPGANAVIYLEWLVREVMCIEVVELDYYRPRLMGGNAANPEIRVEIEGPVQTSLGARLNWIPASVFVPPGRYILKAVALAFGLPEYNFYLKQFAHEPIFVSPPLEIEGVAGETIQLRLGVPEDKRNLPPEHLEFYAQGKREHKMPPPPPLQEIFLEVTGEDQ